MREDIPVVDRYWVLFDPKRERYYSDGGIGRVFAKDAKAFRSVDAAKKQQEFWRNQGFSELRVATMTLERFDDMAGKG